MINQLLQQKEGTRKNIVDLQRAYVFIVFTQKSSLKDYHQLENRIRTFF